MKIQTLLATLGACTIAAASQAGAPALATYDFMTGDLNIQILANDIVLVGVESFGNVDTGATPGNLTAVGGGVDVVPTQFDQDSLAYFFNAAIALDQGSFDIGPVLAPGLSSDDITFEWTTATGETAGSVVNVVNIPEPGSLALLGLGGLAMLRRRRSA